MKVGLDTNVLVAGLRSSRGSSYRLVQSLGSARFETVVSVPLVLEYEAVLLRQRRELGFEDTDVQDLLDYLCTVAAHQTVFYLWRPLLRDPSDDMVLELAVASAADAIVTFNRRDFAGSERFGLKVLAPRDLLRLLGDIP